MANVEKLAISLPRDLVARIRAYQQVRGLTFSAVIRLALSEWVQAMEEQRAQSEYRHYYGDRKLRRRAEGDLAEWLRVSRVP